MMVTALELRLEILEPRRWLKGAGLAVLLAAGQAAGRGSSGSENPWAAEHIEGLPADIRRGITARERACGNKAAARHYFSVSIEAQGRRFTSRTSAIRTARQSAIRRAAFTRSIWKSGAVIASSSVRAPRM